MRTVYRSGRVYSSAARNATALVVEDGIVALVGDDGSVSGSGADAVVDLDGALVTPAFVDAHVHATATGLSLTGLDLGATTSLTAALDRVERAARERRGRPVLGAGWDDSGWPERRPPSARELDRAAYGGSVYLARVDAHSAVASSALLAAVDGLEDLAGYHADGWLTGDAHHAVRAAALATLRPADVRDAQRATRRRAAELGIAVLHEMAGPEISGPEDLRALQELAGAELGPRIVGYWGELLGIEAARDLGAIGAGGDLFCDGSIGSRTAAWSEPYADDPDNRGMLRFGVSELTEHVLRCVRAGLQFGFHAIGDAAVDAVLDAVERASAELGAPAGPGNRIEHAEAVRDPARLARSGLLASMQPAFDAAWGGTHGLYATRLGSATAARLNRFADLAAAGVPLAFGSDAPVTALDPWGTVRAAVHPHDPAAGISPRAAFAAHTRGGWRASGQGDGGRLVPGASATFAVWRAGELTVAVPDERVARWSTDPRAAVPGLPSVAPGAVLPVCVRTVLDGVTIFSAG